MIENIDIGGPTMIRAAAKNFAFAAVVVNPASYDAVLQELTDAGGKLSLGTRESLAAEAFSYTARYDSAISRWFVEKQDDFPGLLLNAFEKVTDLAYGENPHQRAAYYAQSGARMHALSMVRQLGGKELSFNNVLDLNAARLLTQEFELPACSIIKHNNPCGVAVGGSIVEAYHAAFACDPVSAFGGVICVNRTVDRPFAEALLKQFCEVLIAPQYTEEALELLAAKPNMRILEDGERRRVNVAERDLKRVMGGLLVQDRDMGLEDRTEMEVVTERKPSEAEWGEMLFAWKVCKHVRSNAIVLSNDLASVGIGAGQMSRVDSVKLAIDKARAAGSSLHGAALASDAFFPFSDGPQLAVDAGVDRDHPARRLDARPRGRRGRRRRRHQHGLHAPPPLQALDLSFEPGGAVHRRQREQRRGAALRHPGLRRGAEQVGGHREVERGARRSSRASAGGREAGRGRARDPPPRSPARPRSGPRAPAGRSAVAGRRPARRPSPGSRFRRRRACARSCPRLRPALAASCVG